MSKTIYLDETRWEWQNCLCSFASLALGHRNQHVKSVSAPTSASFWVSATLTSMKRHLGLIRYEPVKQASPSVRCPQSGSWKGIWAAAGAKQGSSGVGPQSARSSRSLKMQEQLSKVSRSRCALLPPPTYPPPLPLSPHRATWAFFLWADTPKVGRRRGRQKRLWLRESNKRPCYCVILLFSPPTSLLLLPGLWKCIPIFKSTNLTFRILIRGAHSCVKQWWGEISNAGEL